MPDVKDDLKKLPIKESLDILTENVKNSNNFMMIQARQNALQNQNMLGTVSSSDFNVQQARIQNSLFHFIDELDEDDVQKLQGKLNPDDVIALSARKDADDKLTIEKFKSRKKILFCASNPSKLGELNLYKEYYNLASKINNKDSSFELVQIENTTPSSFLQSIISEKPDFLHFSGHGVKTNIEKQKLAEELGVPFNEFGGIVMHKNDYNGNVILNARTLSVMFEEFKTLVPNLQYIILNACFAEEQAKAISEFGYYAVGYSDEVKDAAASEFTSGFYFGLGAGKDFEDAVRIGRLSAITVDYDFKKILRGFHNGTSIL